MNKTTPKKRNMMKLTAILMLCGAVTGLIACNDLNLDNSPGEGTINFHLTNAPVDSDDYASARPGNNPNSPSNTSVADLQEVNIDVQQLRIRFSEARIDTVNADSITISEDPDAEWIDIPIEPEKINLMDLDNASAMLATTDLEEGFYSEIRLILGNDNDVVDENGDIHLLRVPSGQQSGYKIKFDSQLHSGEEFDLMIVFDVEQSVHRTGNGRYMLNPVLHASRN